ncbi:potassium channel family protein [Kitasatospora sp. CM 4170]|uniref:Potassium channel family protein n=1 Tax=Kitasatospora aburaviensis TaxID=67265 RepID=A0ABW1F7Z8_9ACTN|nr:potassium channel family protein [Kitasatospora sp. CM 4170]WNM49744.1 potassium channel family protein [Kitasatospora sp. CM 4170]
MTAETEDAPRAEPGARPPSWRVVWTLLRVAGSVAVLVALYYALPLDHSSLATAAAVLLTGLVGFAALVALQVRSILRSRYPGLRAVEAMAISIPFFLLLFASAYVTMAAQSPGSFGGSLSHTDGLYFTVTVFSTVGFGDITAHSQAARLVVTGQMVADLVVFGLALKVIVGAVRRSRKRRSTPAASPGDGEDEDE